MLAGFARDAVSSRFALTRYVASVPAAPTIPGTDPVSPSNDSTPRVKGTVGAGAPTVVKLYANASCTGTPAATGSVGKFTGTGIEMTAPEDQGPPCQSAPRTRSARTLGHRRRRQQEVEDLHDQAQALMPVHGEPRFACYGLQVG